VTAEEVYAFAGLAAQRISGILSIEARPVAVMARNQITIMGPKVRPPFLCRGAEI